MTQTMTRAVLTPLDDRSTQRRPLLTRGTPGQHETWQATSADHRWLYERLETVSTPWEVTYLPTGQTQIFGNLNTARRWTGDETRAVAFLRQSAAQVVTRGGHADTIVTAFVAGRIQRVAESAEDAAARCAAARRAVAVIDGALVTGDPDGLCRCGALLIGAVHADVCRECLDDTPADRRRCRLLHQHQACDDVDPVQCDHPQCRIPASPRGDADCRRGCEWCCGCCAE
jgi:hypothetical protein